MINIYIDESGNFVSAEKPDAWNLSAAFIIPGSERRESHQALNRIKYMSGYKISDEIKLKDVNEENYTKFLRDLSRTRCTLYAVAIDSGLVSDDKIIRHRDAQAKGVEIYKDEMYHEEGRLAVEKLASQVRGLSPQLYAQLVCQVELMNDVIGRGITYYVQRIPRQLSKFHWEVDEKLAGVSNFEKTFRIIIPPLLQAKSISKPHVHLTDCDYSSMAEYFYTDENYPLYLRDHYKLNINEKSGLNVGKVVWDDFEFVDSRESVGVQIADLLASGLRRCLRNRFSNNLLIAKRLGALMVEAEYKKSPLRLITLLEEASVSNSDTADVIGTFTRARKNLLRY